MEVLQRQVQLRGIEPTVGALDFLERAAIEHEADLLIANREAKPEIAVGFQERQDNARTALMEALTASGHLSTVCLEGSLEAINAQVISRLLNGFDDSLPSHEKRRRYEELCNELFIQKVHSDIANGRLPADTEVLEISDYSEALKGTKIGYRHENKKGMVRSTGLIQNADGSYTRVIEQVSRSNSSDGSSARFFQRYEISPCDTLTDLDILGNPLLYRRQDFIGGVVDVMKQLDEHAGIGVLYGDMGAQKTRHVPYRLLREESQRREAEIEAWVSSLAELEEQLDGWLEKGLITWQERTRTYKEEVERILNAICTLNPDYAAATFGKRSVRLFHEAAALAASGKVHEAQSLIASNSNMKDEVTFCGVTISAEKAGEMGLKVNSFGQLVEAGKDAWRWKRGKCMVPNCPSPKPTKVGPCSVCRNCQHHADKGANLMRLYKAKQMKTKQKANTTWFN